MKPTQKKKTGIIVLVLCVAVCAMSVFMVTSSNAYQVSKQLKLGQKYLDELKYEQAIATYLAVIDIDEMNVEAYLGAAKAYERMGNIQDAIDVLQKGIDATGDEELLKQIGRLKSMLEVEAEPEKIESTVAVKLAKMPDIIFEIDGIVLGESSLDVAKAKYFARADYKSNLMDDDIEDTVYSMPYMDDDNPDNDMDFGYLFSQYETENVISTMYASGIDFTFSGKYHPGDDANTFLKDFCGIDTSELVEGENTVYEEGSSQMIIIVDNGKLVNISCTVGQKVLRIGVEEGKIGFVDMELKADTFS